MDSLGFTAPAKIRVLLVPVPPIKHATFIEKVKLVKSFETVRLGDVTPDLRANKALFSPQGFSNGQMQFNFVTSYNKEHLYLSEFQPFRRVMGFIGIMDCQEWESLEEGYLNFLKILNYYPQALSHRCFAFDPKDQPDDTRGLIMIPNVGNMNFYMKTMICDFASSLLTSFGNMAEDLEKKQIIESPRQDLIPQLSDAFPASPNTSLVNLHALSNSYASKRRSIPAQSMSSEAVNGIGLAPGASLQHSRSLSGSPSVGHSYNSAQSVIDSKLKKKTAGRLAKLLGDLFVLAGRLPDAVASYNECINFTKANGDCMWHASALEGLAVALVLLGYLHVDLQPTTSPTSSNTPISQQPLITDIPDKYNQALALYAKSKAATGEQAPPLLICEAALRMSRFLSSIWSVGEWGDEALSVIISGGPTMIHDRLRYYSSQSVVTRTDVAAWIMRAAAATADIGPIMDKLFIVTGIASTFGTIGFRRRHAYYLRQTALLVLPLLVQARVSTPANGSASAASSLVFRSYGGHEGDESVLTCLDEFCTIYGVGDLQDRVNAKDIERGTEDMSIGWPDLQVDVLKDSVSIAEALPDYKAMAKYTARLLRRLHPYIPRDEQLRLCASLPQIASSSLKQGNTLDMRYWGANLITSIEVCEPANRKICQAHPLSELPASKGIAVVQEATDPFIYNPFASKKGAAADPMLIQHDLAEFIVSLQNPYAFDLEVSSLSISTSGVDFIANAASTVVPASSMMAVRLTGIATESGILTIRGCMAKIAGCSEGEFTVPLPPTESQVRKVAAEIESRARSRRAGVDALTEAEREDQEDLTPEPTFAAITVIPDQPLLKVKDTNLTHGALMLYEGETSTIRITLSNISSTPVDYIKLSFQDSTILPTQEALANPDIMPEEQYELELFLHKSHVFNWEARDATVSIAPDEEFELQLKCFGKMGCTGGNVQIHYGYVGRERGPDEKAFYTRQLLVPVLMTVTHALEPMLVDVLHLRHLDMLEQESTTGHQSTRAQGMESFLQAVREKASRSDIDFALLSLDVANRWHVPLQVSFTIQDDDTPPVTSSAIVDAGSTSRIVMPIHRMLLDEASAHAPIPSIVDKQYVVPKARSATASAEQERLALFWYKEELLKRLSGEWVEPFTHRKGTMDLRHLRLTRTTLRVLKIDSVRIRVSCDGAKSTTGNTYKVAPNDFCRLEFRVENNRAESLKMFLRILPVNAHPDQQSITHQQDLLLKRLVHHGVLQTPLPRLRQGQSATHVVPICFLSKGTFKFLYHVEEMKAQPKSPHEEQPEVVHYEKEPLTIVVE